MAVLSSAWFPDNIEIVDRVSSFEGTTCGVVVLQMSKATSQALRTRGLAHLKGADRARNGVPYFHWLETPNPVTPYGLDCTALDAETRSAVEQALSEPGSFATTPRGPKYHTNVLIPSRGWAVRTWSGG